MRFNRLDLIRVIDEIEEERAQKHAEQYEPRERAWDDAVADYKANRAPHLTSQLRALVDKTRRGAILTVEDLRTALGVDYHGDEGQQCFAFIPPNDPAAGDRYSTLRKRPTRVAYTPDRELQALKRVLTELTDDEYVTTSVLRELGFSPSLFIKKQVAR